MTTDKPATGWAMDAAKEVIAVFQTAWQDGVRPNREAVTFIIQAAIDEATAAVEAERDEANKDADTACEWQRRRISRLTTQRNDARTTARELATAVRKAGEMMKSVKIFVNNREKIKQPEGRELYDAAIADTEIALTKCAALLAEKEGGG